MVRRVVLARRLTEGAGVVGYAVRLDVNADRVAAAAVELERVSGDVERAGEALARLLVAAGAAGGGALGRAAESAGAGWRRDLGLIAEHGRALARATALAAGDYVAVEAQVRAAWSGTGDGPR